MKIAEAFKASCSRPMALPGLILLPLLLLTAAGAAQAQAPPVQKPLPPIIQRCIAAVSKAQTLSVEMTQVGHFLPRRRPDVHATAALRLERPNRFAVTSSFGGAPSTAAVSDGLMLREWDQSHYTRQTAPESLEGMLAKVQRGLLLGHLDAAAANVAFVVFTHPDALAALPNLQDVGQESIDGVRAHKVVAFTSDVGYGPPLTLATATDKATFWFASDTGLPVQASVTGAFDAYFIRFTHYVLNGPIPHTAFAAAPPAQAALMLTTHSALNFLEAGSPAPDFTLQTLEGKPVTLSALKGRMVLLAFCPPYLPQDFTEAAISLIQEARASPDAKDLTVLWIVETDKPALVAAFVKAHARVPLTVLLDPPPWPQTVEKELYRVQATPTFYVVSRQGRVVAGFLGCRPDKQEIIQADTRRAVLSVLMHGGVPSNALSEYDQASDMMDGASLRAALAAAGLTEDRALQ